MTDEARGDSVINTITGLGGARDKGMAGWADTNRVASLYKVRSILYRFNAVTRRIVDFPAGEAVRAGWEVSGKDDQAKVDRALGVHEAVEDALRWARLHGGAVVVMVSDTNRPEEPMGPDEEVRRLQVVDAQDLNPAAYGDQPLEELWRLPTEWWVGSLRVHHSRCLWFRGAARPPSEAQYETLPDDSVLEAYIDAIYRFTGTMQGGALLAHELRQSILKVHDFETLATSDQAAAFETRVNRLAMMRSILGMLVVPGQDEVVTQSSPPTGFGELATHIRSELSVVEGIPQAVLFGTAPAGLNSSGDADQDMTDRLVERIQSRKLKGPLERLYTQIYGPDGWELSFETTSVPTAAEVADATAKVVVAVTTMADRGLLSDTEARDAVAKVSGWDMAKEDDDADLEELAREALERGAAEGGAPAPVGGGEVVEEKALNGAQITSVLDVLEKLTQRRLTKGMAEVMLVSMLKQDPAAVAKLLADADKVEPPADDAAPPVAPDVGEE